MTGDHRPRLAEIRGVESVYRPAEDSRLLAEAVLERVDADDLVLDVGTGSGYVARRIHEETGARVVGSDVNPEACREAREAGVPVVRADLLEAFRPECFDVVVCNPPYLPTPDGERGRWGDWMERALTGGADGRAVVDPFLADVSRVFRIGGEALLLVSTLTGLDAVRERAREAGLDAETVAQDSYPFERLVVFRLWPRER